MSSPIVYCETNWIVALAFPHHQLHAAAKRLREHSEAGECDVRIPLAALLEARGALSDVGRQLSTSFAFLRDALANARDNGISQLTQLAQALQSDAVGEYARRDVLAVLEDIEKAASINVLVDVTAHFEVLRELRAKVDFKGKDVVDLHLFAAILHDRRRDTQAPALFMSHNKKEFDPRSRRVPADLYHDARMLWRDNFDLKTGVGQWEAEYSPPSR